MSYIKNYLHSKTNLENEIAIQNHSIEKLEPFKDLHAIHERDWDILLNAVQKVDKLLYQKLLLTRLNIFKEKGVVKTPQNLER
jgi:hypothetical protein